MSQRILSIGICCYPTYGGSGVVATEVGMEMARRGHRVHFVSYEVPHRLKRFMQNVFFHEVEVPSYPLFSQYAPYSIALASKLVEVSSSEDLDLIHVHYALPHAVSAFLACQVLGTKAPKIITTLHGTDITVVGNNRSYLPITRMSILASDGVTAVSQYLRQATYDKISIPTKSPIEVIPNFVDLEEFNCCPDQVSNIRSIFCRDDGAERPNLLCHVSNFRPVKRVPDVVQVFARVCKEIPARLILVGDGPERSAVEQLCRSLDVEQDVSFLGKQDSIAEIISSCDVFLLPSETESFGLAALEAMACCVPVVATRAGGIPEVVTDSETGYLSDVGDIETMTANVLRILGDSQLKAALGDAAHRRVVGSFAIREVVDRYEQYYFEVLER